MGSSQQTGLPFKRGSELDQCDVVLRFQLRLQRFELLVVFVLNARPEPRADPLLGYPD